MAEKRRRKRRHSPQEFREDKIRGSFLDKLYLTASQRMTLLRWVLNAAVCLVLLLVQDIIMSRYLVLGGRTDLVVSAILMIGIYYGPETGGVFTMIASLLFLFAGSAPGPYCVALLVFLVVLLGIFQEAFLRKSITSDLLCTCVASFVYQMAVFGIGLFLGVTMFSRVFVFLMTGLITWLFTIPLYPLIRSIARIREVDTV